MVLLTMFVNDPLLVINDPLVDIDLMEKTHHIYYYTTNTNMTIPFFLFDDHDGY